VLRTSQRLRAVGALCRNAAKRCSTWSVGLLSLPLSALRPCYGWRDATLVSVESMSHTWFVTFEVQRRGVLPERRSPRATATFKTEAEARSFARTKLNKRLAVHAGTINPHLPRRIIPLKGIPSWFEVGQEQEADQSDNQRTRLGRV